MGSKRRREYDTIRTVIDEKNRIIDFRSSSLPIPTTSIIESPNRCLQINLDWYPIIAGWLSHLAEIYAWQDAEDENYQAIQEVLFLLEGMECMDCTDVLNCVNTDENMNALYALLLSNNDYFTIQHLTELTDVYDGTPQSIGALIPSIVPSSPEINALCYALQSTMELYASVKLAKIQQKNILQVSWNKLQTAINDAFNGIENLFGFIVSFDLFSCFVSDTTAMSALLDSAVASNVACCLLDELNSVVMSESAFTSAITSCLASLTGNQHDVLCLFDSDYTQQTYLQFLEFYNIALQRQIDGDTLECVCTATWCYTFDFTSSSGDFSAVPFTNTVIPVSWGSTGWLNGWGYATNSFSAVQCSRTFTLSNITSIEIEFDITAFGQWDGLNSWTQLFFNTSSGQLFTATRQQFLDGDRIFSWNGSIDVTSVDFSCINGFRYGANNNPGGTIYCKRITLTGNGPNPFGEDNC